MNFLIPRKFQDDRRGNVAMMYALAMPVLMFGVGLAIDFTHAAQVRTELNAAADAAVLAALTPSMMQQSNATAQTAATNMFNGQIAGITSLAAGDTTVTITVTNPTNNPLVRNVTVAYTAQNENIFASVLGAADLRARRLVDGERVDRRQHQLLSAARQFPVDGPAGDAGGHHADGEPHPAAGRLRVRLPSGEAPTTATRRAIRAEGRHLLDPDAHQLDGEAAATRTALRRAGTQIDDYALARHNGIELRLDALSTGDRRSDGGRLQRPAERAPRCRRYTSSPPIRWIRPGRSACRAPTITTT